VKIPKRELCALFLIIGYNNCVYKNIMSKEFLNSFLPEFKQSPSPSNADNHLTQNLVNQMSAEDHTDTHNDLAIRCLLAWQTKKLPRYLISDNGDIKPDNLSGPLWSPTFYRINLSLTHLRDNLKGMNVLDPFAGSGSMMHALIALNIPNTVVLNDICYRGGKPIWKDENSTGYYYYPQQNFQEYLTLFRKYDLFVKPPDFSVISGHIAKDVSQQLPFNTHEFDWVFSDPPYGRSLESKGFEGLLEYLPETLRVSRFGALLLLPESWLPDIVNRTNYKVEDLTGTLAHKHTTFKTVLAHVYR
jgi:hypothetical protein